jgi:hypothetical protein
MPRVPFYGKPVASITHMRADMRNCVRLHFHFCLSYRGGEAGKVSASYFYSWWSPQDALT